MAWTAQQVADAIAKIESGGNYKARSKSSSASGKYQYIESTWAGYGGYAEAWMAPPAVQDAKAIADISNKMRAYGGDIRKVVMSWFLPAAVSNPALAAKVPKGNAISPNQYADKVMKALGVVLPASSRSGSAENYTTDIDDPAVQDELRRERYGTMDAQLANLMTAISTPSVRTF